MLEFRCIKCHHPISELESGDSLLGFTCPACRKPISIDISERMIGKYEILAKLGRGGFASVWKARNSDSEEIVALKIASRRDDELKLSHLLREARLVRHLPHPNIVRIREIVELDEVAYVISDFIDGTSLDHWTKQHDAGSPKIIQAFIALCRTVHFMHKRDVVHRDLTTSNILLGVDGQMYLIDFGLALMRSDPTSATVERYRQTRFALRQDHAGKGQAGPTVGTLGFMAPEQVRGETDKIGPASDVYSLGAVLYELLTGQRPYQGPRERVVKDASRGKPKRPSRINPRISPNFDKVCRRALAPKLENRFPSASDLADACEQALSSSTPVSKPKGRSLFPWGKAQSN